MYWPKWARPVFPSSSVNHSLRRKCGRGRKKFRNANLRISTTVSRICVYAAGGCGNLGHGQYGIHIMRKGLFFTHFIAFCKRGSSNEEAIVNPYGLKMEGTLNKAISNVP